MQLNNTLNNILPPHTLQIARFKILKKTLDSTVTETTVVGYSTEVGGEVGVCEGFGVAVYHTFTAEDTEEVFGGGEGKEVEGVGYATGDGG